MGYSVLIGLLVLSQAPSAFAMVIGSWVPVPESLQVSLPDSIDPDEGDREHLIFIRSPNRTVQKIQRRRRWFWDLSHPVDQGELHRAIQDPRVKDLVIFTETLPTGQLIDDQGNTLPSDFFERISTGLRSIAIFGCSAEQSIDFYGINRLFESRRSIHSVRTWMAYDGFCEEEGPRVLPDQEFPRFMKQVERKLRTMTRPGDQGSGDLPLDTGESMCAFRFYGFVEGRGSVFLNGHFLGEARFEDGYRSVVGFLCEWLRPNNQLEVRLSGSLLQRTQSNPFQVEAILPGLRIQDRGIVPMPLPANQSFQVRWAFEVESGSRWFPFMRELLGFDDKKRFF